MFQNTSEMTAKGEGLELIIETVALKFNWTDGIQCLFCKPY